MSAYAEASKAVFAVFEGTTPLVEGLSIDEAFLDVRGMGRISGTPREIAVRLRRDVRERVGLPITVGVARTKFLAKVASGVAKPDGLLVVPPDSELSFLHPLPVERLWGVGPVTAAKLHDRGISTVGQVAQLGRGGARLDARPGVRPPPARAGSQPRSRVRCRRAPAPVDRSAARTRASAAIVGGPGAVLVGARRPGDPPHAGARRVCRTVMLRLRFGDFSRATRSHTMRAATAETGRSSTPREGCSRLRHADDREAGLTLVGVTLANLEDGGAVQLALPSRSSAACASMPPSTRARPFRLRGDHARGAAGPRTRA